MDGENTVEYNGLKHESNRTEEQQNRENKQNKWRK